MKLKIFKIFKKKDKKKKDERMGGLMQCGGPFDHKSTEPEIGVGFCPLVR